MDASLPLWFQNKQAMHSIIIITCWAVGYRALAIIHTHEPSRATTSHPAVKWNHVCMCRPCAWINKIFSVTNAACSGWPYHKLQLNPSTTITTIISWTWWRLFPMNLFCGENYDGIPLAIPTVGGKSERREWAERIFIPRNNSISRPLRIVSDLSETISICRVLSMAKLCECNRHRTGDEWLRFIHIRRPLAFCGLCGRWNTIPIHRATHTAHTDSIQQWINFHFLHFKLVHAYFINTPWLYRVHGFILFMQRKW